ncbi:ABC transporter substrate-binding protein [Pseudorhizobium pelagicum]|uniref:ABC transporter substrate-binding protein n=2 Tax=Pseudorhizobium pelagicum TaxID=1509405 RepID=A0A922NXJ5_9HYPH|nr:ABC transporter substrate-binding protein [Pseudorhizobium pelagicum]KEQ03063.1 ABC transporter substrate-binding protein [Pseudorhizobium pelagicum]
MLTKLTTTAAILAISAGAALAEYPEKPITLIVPWAAGGGTDAVARVLAGGLEKELGVSVNVVNKQGGGSVIGHSEMLTTNPDGYTLGFGTAELATFYWAGQADAKASDYTPIALVNFDSGAFHVSASSEYGDVKAALEAIKSQPAGTFKVTGTGTGAAYHLAFAGFLKANGLDPLAVTLVPSQGAAPGFQELAAGGVDFVLSSLPEGTAMMQANKSKPLAVFSDARIGAFPDVPTSEEATGVAFTGGTWRGVVGPQGLEPEVVKTLETAVLKVANSDEFQTFMEEKGFGVRVLDAQGFGDFLAEQHAQVGIIMNDLGIAQRKE